MVRPDLKPGMLQPSPPTDHPIPWQLSPAPEGSLFLGALDEPKVGLLKPVLCFENWPELCHLQESITDPVLPLDLSHSGKELSSFLRAFEHCLWRVPGHIFLPNHVV